MKRIGSLILIALGLGSSVAAETIYVQGAVSGRWSADSVIVTGEIRVPINLSLTIEPGTQVLFQGLYKFIVDANATLTAIGTPAEWIRFDGLDALTEWHGFHFMNSSNATRLEYCLIRKGLANGGFPIYRGGGIYIEEADITIKNCRIENCSADMHGGGIACIRCFPVIVDNLFVGNYALQNGGAIYFASTIYDAETQILSGNIFLQNTVSWHYGGAVCAFGAPPIEIRDNIFSGNKAMEWNGGGSGGALGCVSGSVRIIHNLFALNEAFYMGGAIFCQNSEVLIQDNIIYANAADGEWAGLTYGTGGGIGLDEMDELTVAGNLICSNSSTWEAGGVWASDVMWLKLTGNTITNNSTNLTTGGVFGGYRSQMINNIVWGNTGNQIYQSASAQVNATYCDVQGDWTGTGNINEDPLFVDTGFQDYRLLWDSPCIDSGDPNSLDPDGTRADMGAFCYDQSSPVRILLTPHQVPYLLAADGGWMEYTIRAFNRDSLAHSVTAWCDVTLPNGLTYGPLLGPMTISLGTGSVLEKQRSQYVPASAPMGVYNYKAYAVVGADTSKDNFMFGKMDNGGNNPRIAGTWTNTGEAILDVLPSKQAAQADGEVIPGQFALAAPSPNPFNSSTAISYQLSADSYVSLQIFDTAGRLVVSLVNGRRLAGRHEVTFDAGDLPSGMYLCRLQAGEFEGVQKLVLLK